MMNENNKHTVRERALSRSVLYWRDILINTIANNNGKFYIRYNVYGTPHLVCTERV